MSVIGGSGSSYGHIESVEMAQHVASYRERSQSITNAVGASLKHPEQSQFPADILIAYINSAAMRGYTRSEILNAVAMALYDNGPEQDS